jgi:hypothetical protein
MDLKRGKSSSSNGVPMHGALEENLGGMDVETDATGVIDDTKEKDVTIELDPCALLLQYFIDSGDLSTEHVSYQSMFRLLLGAGGLQENVEMCSHAGNFNTLRYVLNLILLSKASTLLFPHIEPD